jgi:hypothetical protein
MHADLLSLVYQYRYLLGRRDLLRQPLGPEPAARLEALADLFAWRPQTGGAHAPGADRRRMTRCEVTIGAIIEAHGGLAVPSTIVDLGGAGMSLESPAAIRPGEHVTIKVQEQRSGREYRFPAEVRWCREGERSTLGVRFDGLPVELCHRRSAMAVDAAV